MFDRLWQLDLSTSEWFAIVAALVVAIVAAVAVRRLRRSLRREPVRQDRPIDLATLGEAGPPAGGPTLSVYNIPVRVAAIVLAPLGRVSRLPGAVELSAALDEVVPGLGGVVTAHMPIVHRWPAQLSTQGFANVFFAALKLPERGKGSPWTAVAGRVAAGGQKIAVGLVLRAAAANSLGQVVLEREGQWLDVVRVGG